MTPTPPTSRGPSLWLWLLLLITVVVLGGGFWLWNRFDPFVGERPAVKASQALISTARQRPLTQEEFDQAMALLDSNEPIAQISAISVIQIEVERDPSRKAAAVTALEKCQKSANSQVSTSAGSALGRLNKPTK